MGREPTELSSESGGAAVPAAPWHLTSVLAEERARIERILARLQETDDLVERADLGSELVRAASRYEDTLEQSYLKAEPAAGGDTGAKLEEDRDALRSVMTVIHEDTMHVDPRNVHAPDPQGFEDALSEVISRLRSILDDEDRLVGSRLTGASAADRAALEEQAAHAYRHASERPRPPRTRLGRALANAHVKLDHTLEDVATPQHPGAGVVRGPDSHAG